MADNNGPSQAVFVGGEYRYTQTGGRVLVAEAGFTDGASTGYSKSNWPTFVRGSRRGSTTFGCSADGLGISSGRTSEDGSISDVWTLSVRRTPAGTNVCPDNNPWDLSFQPLLLRVHPDDLTYMCSTGEAAYVPSETWDGDFGVCTCNDDLETICSQSD